MCGRYALWIRAREVRQNLQDSNMPSQTEPDDDDYRQTYNFAPGYYGLVYRADVPDYGAGGRPDASQNESEEQPSEQAEAEEDKGEQDPQQETQKEQVYKLQAMKWGLVPFWTKRNPDYGTLMRTINCRDDSLAQGGGMWASMKKRKRCVVIAQGFYEWQKKNNGKEKIPHFIRRKDGQMVCFAGLWDCVQFEDSEEKMYTYTIITTDPNKQMKFLHDRMPVILDPGSEEMFRWLDGNKSEWTKDLQDVLKPFQGELEIFPVTKDVGKVGNNSPSFVVPLNSSENKQNIANFFGNAKQSSPGTSPVKVKSEVKKEEVARGIGDEVDADTLAGTKRSHESGDGPESPPSKQLKQEFSPSKAASKSPIESPTKPSAASSKRVRSATSNGSAAKPIKPLASDGSKKITSFFGK